MSALKILVTEWGIDGGIAHNTPREGWRDMVAQGLMTGQDYVAQIIEGEQRARELPWLLAMFLFNAGSLHPWAGYDHDEGIARSIINAMQNLQMVPSDEAYAITQQEHERNLFVWDNDVAATLKACAELGYVHIAGTGYDAAEGAAVCIAYRRADETWRDLKVKSEPTGWRVVTDKPIDRKMLID